MKKILNAVLFSGLFVVVIGIGLIIFFGIAFGSFEKDYSLSELKDAFDSNSREIYEARNYFYKILPKDVSVEIEFGGGQKIFYFNVIKNDKYFNIYDTYINSKEVDSLLVIVGWKRDHLIRLKSKINEANCISYDDSEGFRIGYQRSGLGKYYFKLLENPLTDSVKNRIDKECVYVYNDSVIFEYGGGALNPDCLYNYH